MDDQSRLHRSFKTFQFDEPGRDSITVRVLELLDPDYGLYIWPSALVLAEYVYRRLDMFISPIFSTRTVLELGAGTALPTLLLAKAITTTQSIDTDLLLIATDRPDVPLILKNIREALQQNGVSSFYPESSTAHVMVRGLGWGDFSFSNERYIDGGLQQLLKDLPKTGASASNGQRKVDIILGSDTLYEPRDFDPLLATVSFIINRHNPDCVFLTTYQDRSSKRNIDHLLQKWDLEARLIEWDDFGFEMSKYVSTDILEEELLEEDPLETVQNINSRMDSHALDPQKGTMEVPAPGPVARQVGKKRVPLVDYSSGSDTDDELSQSASGEGQRTTEKSSLGSVPERHLVSDMSPSMGHQPQSVNRQADHHHLGDGGTLSSVQLLWICKRGQADILFSLWKKKAG